MYTIVLYRPLLWTRLCCMAEWIITLSPIFVTHIDVGPVPVPVLPYTSHLAECACNSVHLPRTCLGRIVHKIERINWIQNLIK